MMKDAAAALYAFFNGFGIPAHTSGNVPQDAELPYLTYDLAIAPTFGSVPIAARLWYEGTLPTGIFEKADEIHKALNGGANLNAGNGGLMLYEGTPFMQSVPDEDDKLSTLYLNIEATFCLD